MTSSLMAPMARPEGRVKTPTSKAGTSNNRGFTFVELLLVLLVVGTALLWIAPRLTAFQVQDVRSAARHLAGQIRYLAGEAAVTRRTFRLHYHLQSGEYWTTVLDENGEETAVTDPLVRRRQSLPEGVAFEAIVTAGQGEITQGETSTEVHPFGVEKTSIHLKSKGEHWLLKVHPLTGEVSISNESIE